ncbi:hypothetical protein [Lysinibacillus sp. LZ02]|uniref:hypothetical protein n=1 Tax=Lysinibacillus sp. LZ02 TaxID=3420668 RepID=UPI003D35A848
MPNNPFSGNLLRNFTVEFLDATLSDFWNTSKEYRSIKNKMFEDNSFHTITKILESKAGENVDKQKLDAILFNDLAWVVPDNHFIYLFDTPDDIVKIKDAINGKTNSLDRPIHHSSLDKEAFQLVSMRQENNSLVLLFRNGYTKDEDTKKTIFFIACEYNFTKKTFIIKIRENFRQNAQKKRRELISEIFTFIKDLTPTITYIRKTKKEIKDQIYKLFKNETEKAESIIKSKLPLKEQILDKEIEEFNMHKLKLVSPETLESNNKIIKYMYFQNIAQNLELGNFSDRYIFAFSFHDGNTTRSVTRDSLRKHIYSKKLYWNLKSLVTEKTKVDEISIYYRINKKNYKLPPLRSNFTGLEVTIKEFHGSFMIDYYNNKRRDFERKMKSEFVLYELEEYL